MRIRHFLLYLCLLNSNLQAGTLFNLPNPISATAFGKLSGLFFVGSAIPSTDSAAVYALAIAGRNDTSFTGIAPQEIFINGVSQVNPLYGAQIDLLVTTGRFAQIAASQTDSLPALTLANDPNHVYVVTSYTAGSNPTLLISPTLLDTSGNAASSIDSLAGSVQGVVYAAVGPQGGVFGQPGSGIADAQLVTQTTGLSLTFGLPASIDVASPLVALGGPLQSLTDPTLYVSNYKTIRNGDEINVGTLFAGFNLVGGSGASDGGIAVVSTLGNVGAPLTLLQITPATAVTTDSIIAATGTNTQIHVFFLGTLFPSVGTQYLVVVGGVGDANADPLNVYAMPLTVSGLLANVNAAPTVVPATGLFMQREFTIPAVAPGDLYSSSNVQAQVGGGAAPGTITSLYTSGDSVIITVQESATQSPGIFYSQAIFDITPTIIGWTPWQRAVQTEGQAQTSLYDPVNVQFWYTTALTSTVQSVVRTAWNENETPLVQLLNNALPLDQGGIQGITDLVATSSLFSQVSGNRISATIFTGFKTIVLAETAVANSGILTPITSYPQAQMFTDGTLQGFTPPAQYISMTGGALADLSAIIAATVVNDGTQSWIVVGGNGGLAVLALPDGSGILNGSITQNFNGISPDLAWQPLGNYSNVRKLVCQNGFLYILTDTLFERVELTFDLISGVTPFNATNLATAGTLSNKLYLFFSDVIVSEPLVVLATSSGLIRGGNGVSVQDAASAQEMNWTEVVMPETTGCATRLLAITQTGQETDLYQEPPGVSGNLYVLSGNVSLDQARIYRYVVTYSSSGISDTTFQLFNDYFVIGEPTFFINMGYYRNFFYTDGLLWSTSRSRYILEKLFVQSLPVPFISGSRARVAKNGGFFTDAAAHSVGLVKRLSGLGSWVIPGDFGLVVHQ